MTPKTKEFIRKYLKSKEKRKEVQIDSKKREDYMDKMYLKPMRKYKKEVEALRVKINS